MVRFQDHSQTLSVCVCVCVWGGGGGGGVQICQTLAPFILDYLPIALILAFLGGGGGSNTPAHPPARGLGLFVDTKSCVHDL